MAKLAAAKIEKAMQVAAVVASGIAVNGTIPTEKSLRQCCLTGLKIVLAMDSVVSACDEFPELLDEPLESGEGYNRLGDRIASQKQRAKDAKEAETATADGAAVDVAAADETEKKKK